MGLKRRDVNLVISIILFTVSLPLYAFGIWDAYSLALEKDPTYQAALKEKIAGEENKNIGRAGLLPKVRLSYQNSPRNWQTQQYQQPRSIWSQELTEVTKHQQYRSYSGSVLLTQPLFDYEAYARYKAGIAQSMLSDERYRGKLLDLGVRVVNAYVDVANAKEQIALVQAQKLAYKEQLALNERLLKAGEGSTTDVLETQARYSLAVAQELEAYDALDSAKRNLELIVGVPLEQLDKMQELKEGPFKIIALTPSSYEAWHKIALERNPVLAAVRHGVEVAKYEVERNRSGFMPNVQFMASHSENKSSTDNTVNQKYLTDTIGIQVSMPLFSGGGVLASTRQAAARYGQAMYEMDEQFGSTLNELRKQYHLCISTQSKVTAYELAVRSAAKQLEATRRSVIAGQRVNLDVLNAEQQLYIARKDLAGAKYTYIKSWISLLNNAGVLDEKAIIRVAQYFIPVR